jgi:hypothetical protein
MVWLETAVLEKAHLSGLLFEVERQVRTKFPGALFPGQRTPVRISFRQCGLDDRLAYAPLAEIQANADRAFTLVDTGLDEAL